MEFFKQFNVVLNGLDNLDARRHVNRLCLAADVPLVESGTTGFLGQVILYIYELIGKSIHFLCQFWFLSYPKDFAYLFSCSYIYIYYMLKSSLVNCRYAFIIQILL